VWVLVEYDVYYFSDNAGKIIIDEKELQNLLEMA
jgi:uncharacterized protein with ATP-grasp and redox domains